MHNYTCFKQTFLSGCWNSLTSLKSLRDKKKSFRPGLHASCFSVLGFGKNFSDSIFARLLTAKSGCSLGKSDFGGRNSRQIKRRRSDTGGHSDEEERCTSEGVEELLFPNFGGPKSNPPKICPATQHLPWLL